MTLAEYRTEAGLTLEKLADMLGISGASRARTVHRYITHERIPDRATIRKLEAATGGMVCSADFPDVPARKVA